MSEAKEAIFRSAEMSLAQIYISNEVSRDVVAALGELGCIQFRDLNAKVSNFQRAFVKEIRTIDNSLRQVRYLRDNMHDQGITEFPVWDGQQPDVEDIPAALEILERQISGLQSSKSMLLSQQAALVEHRVVLEAGSRYFGHQESELSPHAASTDRGFDVVAGVIPKDNVQFLERIAWRALRGNLLVSSGDAGRIYELKAKAEVEKSVFIIVTHGSELVAKASKVAEALDGHLYPVTPQLCRSKLHEVNAQLSEMEVVVQSTREAVDTELQVAARSIETWALHLAREKAVYETLNRFSYDPGRKVLIGEGWIPSDEIERVKRRLRSVSESVGVETPAAINILQTNRTPPTFHRTNKITYGFQSMVDVYAPATYQEVNPGLPTVITFPFMFAVMFGDMGHGFIMAAAAYLLVYNERKLAKVKGGDVFDMAYSGRYVLLFMGLFSMYTGFLYNDLFSRSLTLFPSGWEWPQHKLGETVKAVQRGVYAIGIDPAWHAAENNLLFMNSYKMKLSVLLGWIHMTYSHCFSLVNHLHFKSMINIIGVFVPEVIFFQGIFGYLSLTIIYKWCVDWTQPGAGNPPSLMNMLINMFLAPGKIDDPLFRGQKPLQLFLVVAALIAVPWLLLSKPLYLKRKMEQQHYETLPYHDEELGAVPENAGEIEEDEDEDNHVESFGDILIHQVIHTIEFCLNTVSHTASYLRLWALSLAHAQLSGVLWSMTLQLSFGMSGVVGVVMIVVMFALWGSLTVAILVAMEGTSAMLHALRLHWVESMSKFYIGEGVPFEPFSYENIEA